MKKNKLINTILDNFKTLFWALLIALLIRSLIIQPFYIPSSSMEPNLLVGDRLFVTKYSYGYSKHSFPFSPPILQKRIFSSKPNYGDLVVFKTPSDNRTDFIKRLIGLPGDEIQIRNGELFINNKKILKTKIDNLLNIRCGENLSEVYFYQEELPNKKKYTSVYNRKGSMVNSDIYIVPDKHYFFLGDNRDCSKDSRFLSEVGYVHKNNLVGKAQFLFFSSDPKIGSIFKIWKWNEILRIKRFFKKII